MIEHRHTPKTSFTRVGDLSIACNAKQNNRKRVDDSKRSFEHNSGGRVRITPARPLQVKEFYLPAHKDKGKPPKQPAFSLGNKPKGFKQTSISNLSLIGTSKQE